MPGNWVTSQGALFEQRRGVVYAPGEVQSEGASGACILPGFGRRFPSPPNSTPPAMNRQSLCVDFSLTLHLA